MRIRRYSIFSAAAGSKLRCYGATPMRQKGGSGRSAGFRTSLGLPDRNRVLNVLGSVSAAVAGPVRLFSRRLLGAREWIIMPSKNGEKAMNIDRHGFPPALGRRSMLVGAAAATVVGLLGCSSPSTAGHGAEETLSTSGSTADKAMVVFRDPSCGCCHAWAEIARTAGYAVEVRDHPDMAGLKRQLGVPEQLASCHTAQIAGLVIEGHVPLADVARLLEVRPPLIKGIAVAGMPLGSPGMEVPNGAKQPFRVMAFGDGGTITEFSA